MFILDQMVDPAFAAQVQKNGAQAPGGLLGPGLRSFIVAGA